MSDTDFVIQSASKIEEILRNDFGGKGDGLFSVAKSLDYLLPDCLIGKIAYIAKVRNPFAHGKQQSINPRDREGFERACITVEQDLQKLLSLINKAPNIPANISTARIVCYCDVIKLKHVMTGNLLHSHWVNYTHPGTSGQQQITAFGGLNNDDYWVIKSKTDTPREHLQGTPIRNGDIIRLEHIRTDKNLHSHFAVSPISGQQEVTCFGESGIGNTDDDWRIEVQGGEIWTFNHRIRLIHVATNGALHSHAWATHPEYTCNQQEVTCITNRDDNDFWMAYL